MHASPFEHAACPATGKETVLGNFNGWHQHRHEIQRTEPDRWLPKIDSSQEWHDPEKVAMLQDVYMRGVPVREL